MNIKRNQKIINNLQQSLFMEQIEQIVSTSTYLADSVRDRLESKFKDRMYEELKLSSSVSYVDNKKIPFLRIYRYKEAFAFNFVKDFLKRFNANFDYYVFEQFSGLGTTMFTFMIYSST